MYGRICLLHLVDLFNDTQHHGPTSPTDPRPVLSVTFHVTTSLRAVGPLPVISEVMNYNP